MKFLSKIKGLLFAAALAAFWAAPFARAHEIRPAYLEITQTAAENFKVFWRVPHRGDQVISLRIQWPDSCREVSPASRQEFNHAVIEKKNVQCSGGLEGKTITIQGLALTATDVLARIQFLDKNIQTKLIKPAEPLITVLSRSSRLEIAREYFVLGVEHILLGVDHLLFVLGLLLIVKGVGPLLKTVTAFTIAHSVTLGAAVLGWVRVPSAPVEAVIALSILFLAYELVRVDLKNQEPGLIVKHPWIAAFSFGLLHGFGFAGVLTEVGLPSTDIPLALLFFNIGVEAGQVLFILSMLFLGRLLRNLGNKFHVWPRAAAYAIGSISAFWLIERVAQFAVK